jgi:hypothetical protein
LETDQHDTSLRRRLEALGRWERLEVTGRRPEPLAESAYARPLRFFSAGVSLASAADGGDDQEMWWISRSLRLVHAADLMLDLVAQVSRQEGEHGAGMQWSHSHEVE